MIWSEKVPFLSCLIHRCNLTPQLKLHYAIIKFVWNFSLFPFVLSVEQRSNTSERTNFLFPPSWVKEKWSKTSLTRNWTLNCFYTLSSRAKLKKFSFSMRRDGNRFKNLINSIIIRDRFRELQNDVPIWLHQRCIVKETQSELKLELSWTLFLYF